LNHCLRLAIKAAELRGCIFLLCHFKRTGRG
jgi:hypothetical protein